MMDKWIGWALVVLGLAMVLFPFVFVGLLEWAGLLTLKG